MTKRTKTILPAIITLAVFMIFGAVMSGFCIHRMINEGKKEAPAPANISLDFAHRHVEKGNGKEVIDLNKAFYMGPQENGNALFLQCFSNSRRKEISARFVEIRANQEVYKTDFHTREIKDIWDNNDNGDFFVGKVGNAGLDGSRITLSLAPKRNHGPYFILMLMSFTGFILTFGSIGGIILLSKVRI